MLSHIMFHGMSYHGLMHILGYYYSDKVYRGKESLILKLD